MTYHDSPRCACAMRVLDVRVPRVMTYPCGNVMNNQTQRVSERTARHWSANYHVRTVDITRAREEQGGTARLVRMDEVVRAEAAFLLAAPDDEVELHEEEGRRGQPAQLFCSGSLARHEDLERHLGDRQAHALMGLALPGQPPSRVRLYQAAVDDWPVR